MTPGQCGEVRPALHAADATLEFDPEPTIRRERFSRMPHLIRRQFPGVLLVLTVCSLAAATGGAQEPWNVAFNAPISLTTGYCAPIGVTVLDARTNATPRNPLGAGVSIAHFDMTVASKGAVVGRYSGASAWAACACPGSAGAVATITATYPAVSLAESARVRGVAFTSTIDVPIVDRKLSGTPIGCETYETTTVGAETEAPWTVTLLSNTTPIPIGSCSALQVDLRDATGKEHPRNPAAQLVSIADFDVTVTAARGGAVVEKYNDARYWGACACQGASAGELATITASYPARGLAERARVPDVAFQSSITIPLADARGTFDPPACASAREIAVAPSPAPAPAPPPPAAEYKPGPATVSLALSANGSWDEYAPGPAIVTLALSANGSWNEYVPGPVIVSLALSAQGSWK